MSPLDLNISHDPEHGIPPWKPDTNPDESCPNTATSTVEAGVLNVGGSGAQNPSDNADASPTQSVGEILLNSVQAYLLRFIAYPSHEASVAHTLWIAHTHLMDIWESTPRIAFLSPEPASGKTRALEITETLVPRPVESMNASPAYIFRKISEPKGRPTLLYDEIDTIFGPKARDNEELRGVLNAGHRLGATAGRCVYRGNNVETEELPAYCAVALAGLGNLPDTILTRSIVIRMRRRAPSERVEPYRRRIHAAEGNRLRDELAAWATQIATNLNTLPVMPIGIEDRNADVCEPLLAIADAAGIYWAKQARVALVADAGDSTPSLGIRLLSDMRIVFGTDISVPTDEILRKLCSMVEAPWGDIHGKPIDPRRLASLLHPYGIRPQNIRIGDKTLKGYKKEDLNDPWNRYLGQSPPASATSATSATSANSGEVEAEV